MDAGLMKHRVDLMRAVLTPLSGGSFSETYTVFAVGWAAIRSVSAVATSLSAQELERRRFRVTLRSRPGIDAADMIQWAGRSLRVLGVDEGAAGGRFTVFICEEERGR